MKTIKKILAKTDEWLFDYHIRGCKLLDKKSNEICDKNKRQFKAFLRTQITELLEGLEKDLDEIKEWPEPQPGAGEGLGALAGVGMYQQYDHDRKKHKEQIQEINNKIKEIIGK